MKSKIKIKKIEKKIKQMKKNPFLTYFTLPLLCYVTTKFVDLVFDFIFKMK